MKMKPHQTVLIVGAAGDFLGALCSLLGYAEHATTMADAKRVSERLGLPTPSDFMKDAESATWEQGRAFYLALCRRGAELLSDKEKLDPAPPPE